jgi:hypothetical protein
LLTIMSAANFALNVQPIIKINIKNFLFMFYFSDSIGIPFLTEFLNHRSLIVLDQFYDANKTLSP